MTLAEEDELTAKVKGLAQCACEAVDRMTYILVPHQECNRQSGYVAYLYIHTT